MRATQVTLCNSIKTSLFQFFKVRMDFSWMARIRGP
jgi:hypothetical protein